MDPQDASQSQPGDALQAPLEPSPAPADPGGFGAVGAPDGLSDAARQEMFDISIALRPHMADVEQRGETRSLDYEPIPELENKQWVFERSEWAQDIQRVQDANAPG